MELPSNCSEKLFKVITPFKQPIENQEKKLKLVSPLALLVAGAFKSLHNNLNRETNVHHATESTTLSSKAESYNVADRLFKSHSVKTRSIGGSALDEEPKDVVSSTSLDNLTQGVGNDANHDLFSISNLPNLSGNQRNLGGNNCAQNCSSVFAAGIGSEQVSVFSRDDIFGEDDPQKKSFSRINNYERQTSHHQIPSWPTSERNQPQLRKNKKASSLVPSSQSQFLEEQEALWRNCSRKALDDQQPTTSWEQGRPDHYYRSLYRRTFHDDPAPQPGLTQPGPSQMSQTVADKTWEHGLEVHGIEDLEDSTKKTPEMFCKTSFDDLQTSSVCPTDCHDNTEAENTLETSLESLNKDCRVPYDLPAGVLETFKKLDDDHAIEIEKAGNGLSISHTMCNELLRQGHSPTQKTNGFSMANENNSASLNSIRSVKSVSRSRIYNTSNDNMNVKDSYQPSELFVTGAATTISSTCTNNDNPTIQRINSYSALKEGSSKLEARGKDVIKTTNDIDSGINSISRVQPTQISAERKVTPKKFKQGYLNFDLDLSCLLDEEDEWFFDSVGAVVNETIENKSDVCAENRKENPAIVPTDKIPDETEVFHVASLDAEDIDHTRTQECPRTTTEWSPLDSSSSTRIDDKNDTDVNSNPLLTREISITRASDETMSAEALNLLSKDELQYTHFRDVETGSNADKKILTLKTPEKALTETALMKEVPHKVLNASDLNLARNVLNTNEEQGQMGESELQLRKLKNVRHGFKVPFKNSAGSSPMKHNIIHPESPKRSKYPLKCPKRPSTPTLRISAPLATSTPRNKNLGVFSPIQSPATIMLERLSLLSPSQPSISTTSATPRTTSTAGHFIPRFALPTNSSATRGLESKSPSVVHRSKYFAKHELPKHSDTKAVNAVTLVDKPSFMMKLKAFSFLNSGTHKSENSKENHTSDTSDNEDPFSFGVVRPQKLAMKGTEENPSLSAETHSDELTKETVEPVLTAKFKELETTISSSVAESESGAHKLRYFPTNKFEEPKKLKHSLFRTKRESEVFKNRSLQSVPVTRFKKPETVNKLSHNHKTISEVPKQHTLQPVLMDVFKKPSAILSKRKRSEKPKGSKQSSVEETHSPGEDGKRRKTETFSQPIVSNYLDGEIYACDERETDLFADAIEIAMCLLYSDGSSQLWERAQACIAPRNAAGHVTGVAFAVSQVSDGKPEVNATMAIKPRVIRVPIPAVGDAAFAKSVVDAVMQSRARKLCFDAQETVTCLAQRFRVIHTHVLQDWHLLDPKIGAWLLDADHPPVTFTATLAQLGVAAPEQRTLTGDLGLLSTLMRTLQGRLTVAGLWPIFFCLETRIASSLAVMELRGVKVDRAALSKNSKVLSDKICGLERKCERVSRSVVNVNSPCQLRALLYNDLKLDSTILVPTTPAGHKSTSEQALELLRGTHPIIELLLQHRRLSKLRNTFVAGVSSCVKNGYIYPAWEQTSAATGRIQCRSPNLQALPKHPVPLSGLGDPHLTPEYPEDENSEDIIFGDGGKALNTGLEMRVEDADSNTQSCKQFRTDSHNLKQKSHDDPLATPSLINGNNSCSYASMKNSNINVVSNDKSNQATIQNRTTNTQYSSPEACYAENVQVSPKENYYDIICPASSSMHNLSKQEKTDGLRKADAVTVTARSALCSEADCVLVSADFQQMELRLLAHFSQDFVLLEAFKTHQDVFAMLTQKWSSLSSVSSRERSKRLVYAMLYGAGQQKLSQVLQATPSDAAAAIASFNNIVPGVASFRRRVVEECRRHGYLMTLFKRRRHFPFICSQDPRLRSHAERQAINFVIQGSAADLCKAAQLRMEAKLSEYPHMLSMTSPSYVGHDPTQTSLSSTHCSVQSNQKSKLTEFFMEPKTTKNEVDITSVSPVRHLDSICIDNHCSSSTAPVENIIVGSSENTNSLQAKKTPASSMKTSSKDQRLGLLLHIHDELVWQVPRHSVTQFVGVVREVMEDTAGLCGPLAVLTVPLPVSLRVGTHWGDMRPWPTGSPGTHTLCRHTST